MNSYQTAAETAATGMKSDLLCQELLQPPCRLHLQGKQGKQPQEKHIPREAAAPGPAQVPRWLSSSHQAWRTSRRVPRCCRAPAAAGGRAQGAQRGAAKDRAAPREGKQAPGCIFRQKTGRIFFSFLLSQEAFVQQTALQNQALLCVRPLSYPIKGRDGFCWGCSTTAATL